MTIKNKTTKSGIIVPDNFKVETKEYSTNQILSMLNNSSANWLSGDNTSSLIHAGLVRNPIAAACIRIISTAVGQLNFQIHDSRGNLVEDTELNDLLNRPSVDQSGNSFFKNLERDKLTFGSAYIRGVRPDGGAPTELHLLRPSNVHVEKGHYMLPRWYDYQHQYGLKERFQVDPVNGECDVLRIYDEHPTDIFASLSRLSQAAQDIAMHNEGADWNKQLLQNGARVDGILSITDELTDESRAYIEQQFNTKHRGTSNAGKTLIIEGEGAKFTPSSMSPKDVDFLKGRVQAARDIATVFGVPSQLLNIPDSQTYNNNREAKLALYELVILPEADEICNELNHWLMPMFGDFIVSYDKNEISALQVRRDELWDRLDGAAITTANERREMLGLEPLAEAEVITPPAKPAKEEESKAVDDEQVEVSVPVDETPLVETKSSDNHTHFIDINTKNGHTTTTDGHSHEYTVGAKHTGITDGHRHEMNGDGK